MFVSSLSPLLYRRELNERSRLNPEMLSTILRTPFGVTKNRLCAAAHRTTICPLVSCIVPIRATFYNPFSPLMSSRNAIEAWNTCYDCVFHRLFVGRFKGFTLRGSINISCIKHDLGDRGYFIECIKQDTLGYLFQIYEKWNWTEEQIKLPLALPLINVEDTVYLKSNCKQ